MKRLTGIDVDISSGTRSLIINTWIERLRKTSLDPCAPYLRMGVASFSAVGLLLEIYRDVTDDGHWVANEFEDRWVFALERDDSYSDITFRFAFQSLFDKDFGLMKTIFLKLFV